MKIKKLFFCLIIATTFSACSKLPYGDGSEVSKEKIVLTSENYLYEGDLERIYLNEEIAAIDVKLDNLKKGKTNKGDEREELLKVRAQLKNRIAEIIDLSSVGKNFPVPCNVVGKCVPVRLGYFVVSTQVSDIAVVVSTLDGKKKLASAELSPLPGFESKLQVISLPVSDLGKQIEIQITKNDQKGMTTEYAVIFD